MSLRRRLTITVAVLLVVGLAAADVVIYTSLRSFLDGRLDAQLLQAQREEFRYLSFAAAVKRPPTVLGVSSRVSTDIYVVILRPDGTVLLSSPSFTVGTSDPTPILPARLPVQTGLPGHGATELDAPYAPSPASFVMAARGHDLVYRAVAVAAPQGTLVTAVSTGPTRATLASLLRVEALASVATVIGVCALALWTVRRGLRPLEVMARTASSVASGDLGRRIPSVSDRTEVGRLSEALNVMLARIEQAFAATSASEDRLRRFAADASHELRTPLTSIRGYAELLRKGALPDPAERERALARVEEEAARMGILVDDLLLLARLDQGRPLEQVEVDLTAVCVVVVDDARTVAAGRLLTLDAPDGPVVVLGDRDRLAQVAHNLVRNALQHTPDGTKVTVEVRLEGEMGRLRVSDDGPGFDAQEAERVFDRFHRAATSRRGEGSGLGLAIVRAIAEASGGWAAVASTPGEGTTFSVSLPAAHPKGPVAGRKEREDGQLGVAAERAGSGLSPGGGSPARGGRAPSGA